MKLNDGRELLYGSDGFRGIAEAERQGVVGVLHSQFSVKDGSQVIVFPLRRNSEQLLIETFERLSPQSVYRRFFSPLRELPPELVHHLANVDYVRRFALIAQPLTDGDEYAAGVARYDPTGEAGVVELALVVIDEWQGQGLGRILLRSIMSAAAEHGFHRFRANVLLENQAMLHLIESECNIHSRTIEEGVVTLTFSSRAERSAGTTRRPI